MPTTDEPPPESTAQRMAELIVENAALRRENNELYRTIQEIVRTLENTLGHE